MGDIERQKSREFGHYDVFEALGYGGIGEAYVARSQRGEHAGTFVCLKIMGREFQAASGSRRREAIDSIRHEARIVSRLRHPNIAALLDSGAFNDVWFLAFELVDGATLGEVLDMQSRGRGLSPDHVRRIGIAVAGALHCAHEHDVLHRDIKPSNIMVGVDGQVKLVDFGMAKANARNAADFTVGVGTPRYWAPEQIREEPLGPPTDIYALGVVLYELLATVHPFHDDDPVEFRRNVLRGVPHQDLREYGVPEDLAAIIESCLRTEAHQRFQSGAALGAALRSGAKASGFEYDMGEIASAAREIFAEQRFIASDDNTLAEPGNDGETIAADLHRRPTHFETPQALAEEIRDALPGSMSDHVRDQVMDDLSVLARQARDRRHSHTARRRDSSPTEGPGKHDSQAVTRLRPDDAAPNRTEPPTAIDGTLLSLSTPRRRRSRETAREPTRPEPVELKGDAPAPLSPTLTEPQPPEAIPPETIAVTSRKRVAWSVAAIVTVGVAVAVPFVLAPNRSASVKQGQAPRAPTTSAPTIAAKPEPAAAPTPLPPPPPLDATATRPAARQEVTAVPERAVTRVARRSTAASTTTRATQTPGPTVQVTVGLIPYGQVLIDGKRAGVAPVVVKLAEGPHRIVGRNPEFRVERTVVVTPEVHGVVLDLRDGKPSN